MKNFRFFHAYFKLFVIVFFAVVLNGCKEKDYLENNKPSWLGESIYDQLKLGYTEENGTVHTFNTFTKLVTDLGYDEVLRLTGSKTLFVADDAAFDRFYANNPWGVKSYNGFTLAQKKLLLNSAMINNAYLVDLMANTQGPVEGQALRRLTAYSPIDTVTHELPAALSSNNENWDFYREKGIYLLKDQTPVPMVHFLQRVMEFRGMTNEDFSALMNGKQRQQNDAYIYNLKVLVRDITCKNGYINILEDVLLPANNMAEIIRTTPEVKVFSAILERFSYPLYNATATQAYRLLNPTFTDSIFNKKYSAELSSFGERGMQTTDAPTNGKGVRQAGFLAYDPGWNMYYPGNNAQTDMGAMFVPTDEAINDYFNNRGGKFLLEKYGSIENIPTDVLDKLVRNHMKSSFMGSLPHLFDKVLDDGKEPMGVSLKDDVVKTLIANNGVVYITKKLYAPAHYVAVTAPVLINDYTKIMNWAVKKLGFDAYLLSMESRYSFMVPLDIMNVAPSLPQSFYYVDPVGYGKKQPEVFKFTFKAPNIVMAAAFKYDIATGEIGDSIRTVTAPELVNRFNDILDYHIVVGNIEDGKSFYKTKGGGEIKVTNSGGSLKLLGGGNIDQPTFNPNVTKVYDQTRETNGRGNGKAYLIDAPLLPPYRSVYKVLSGEPRFSEFFRLLHGNDQWTEDEIKKYAIFYIDAKYAGMGPEDLNVKSFNTYHYSVYVPTNAAVQRAVADGLPTWDVINKQTDQMVKDSLTGILLNFLRYHFQDNSVYVDGVNNQLTSYETAAYTLKGAKAYYKVYAEVKNNDLLLYNSDNQTGTPVKVDKTNGLYNIMARDYKFNKADIEKATAIETSSWAVIHQIDNYLLYQKDAFKKARRLVSRYKK